MSESQTGPESHLRSELYFSDDRGQRRTSGDLILYDMLRAEKTNLCGAKHNAALQNKSNLVTKVDSACLSDSYDIIAY